VKLRDNWAGYDATVDVLKSAVGHGTQQSYVSQTFSKIPITIGHAEIAAVDRMVAMFETRDKHPLALNSQLLGVHKMVFTDHDRQQLFRIFGLEELRIKSLVVSEVHSIPSEWKVVSDPFALLSFWLIHLAEVVIRIVHIRQQFQLNVARYLLYRWFTSLTNHYFSHGADERIMTVAVNRLSRKYDIVKYGTWREVMVAMCNDLVVDPKGVHRDTLDKATNDKAIIYAIGDFQTRLRAKIRAVTEVYYEVRDSADRIQTESATSELDGEKVLTQTVSTFDAVISNLCIEIVNTQAFIDMGVIRQVASLFQSISSPEMLRDLLVHVSDEAASQSLSRTLDKTVKASDGAVLYIGIRALITRLIQVSFRHCIKNGIPITSKAKVLIAVKNAFSSSRITDPDIVTVKKSVIQLVDAMILTPREATKSSLRLAVIIYILAKGFRYM